MHASTTSPAASNFTASNTVDVLLKMFHQVAGTRTPEGSRGGAGKWDGMGWDVCRCRVWLSY